MTELALKERMETRKENFMLRVDTHTDMIGMGLSKITPLMTQATSALCVGYASYEGVNTYFDAHWSIAVLVGLVAGIATEGIGFIAVDERDKAEAHNRRTTDKAQHVSMAKGNAYVAGSFLITMAIVAAFESVPALIRYYDGSAILAEVLFRCGLLVFPFLSRLGANLFAFRAVRESVDTLSDDQELRRLKLSLAKQELIAKSAARVEKVGAKSIAKPAEEMATQSATSQKVKPVSRPIGYDEQMAMLTIYQSEPTLSDEKMAVRIGKSKKTIQDLLADLAAKEVVHIQKGGRGKTVTVNGKFSAFQAGEI